MSQIVNQAFLETDLLDDLISRFGHPSTVG